MPRIRPTSRHHLHERFGDVTMAWSHRMEDESLKRYLERYGVWHLLWTERHDDAQQRLLQLGFIVRVFRGFPDRTQPMAYWRTVGLENARKGYGKMIKQASLRVHPIKANDLSPADATELGSFFRVIGLQRESRALWTKVEAWTSKQTSGGKTMDAVQHLTRIMKAQGDPKETPESRLAYADQYLPLFSEVFGPLSEIVLSVRRMRANELWSLGRQQVAIDELRELLEVSQELSELKASVALNIQRDLAGVLHEQKDPACIALMADVVSGRTQELGADHPSTYQSRRRHAAAVYNLGDRHEGIELMIHIYESCRDTLGPQDLVTVDAAVDLGGGYSRMDEHAKAAEYRWLALKGAVLMSDVWTADNRTRWKRTVASMKKAGDTDGMRRLYQWRMETSARQRGVDHPNTLITENNLAWFLLRQGWAEDASPLFERLEKAWATHDESWRPIWANVGWTLCKGVQGTSYEEAEASIKQLEKILGADSAKVQSARKILAKGLAANER